MSLDADLPVETQALLDRYGFDAATFAFLRKRFVADPAGFKNAVTGLLQPPGPGDLIDFPALATDAHQRLAQRGMGAFARGEVAALVLAGGMATRFGGAVKADVPVLAGATFLDLKLAEINETGVAAGAPIDVFFMTSFATHDAISTALGQVNLSHVDPVAFPQFISLRLCPDGQIFRGPDGRPSPYAPGHGDMTFALRRSGLLADFLKRGGKHLVVSNVDNLAAVCDPAIVGAHLESGAQATFEVVAKAPGDKGGAPARLDGRLQIVEEFRFPPDFDQDRIPVFNTNTFVLDARAADQDADALPLHWFAAHKVVDGAPVVQFEHLVGQLTAFLPSAFLRVPRGGSSGRFLPVKDPAELAQRLPEIRAVLHARGLL